MSCKSYKSGSSLFPLSYSLRPAFTLAEVLITLGIIGVIAALTIPTLLNATQKQTQVTQLKKAYSTVGSAFRMLMAEEGVSEFGDTSLFNGSAASDATRQGLVDVAIRKQFKVVKSCLIGDSSCEQKDYKFLGISGTKNTFSSSSYNFFTADSTYYQFDLYTSCPSDATKIGKMKAVCAALWVDANGRKPPNTIGRDVFLYWIAQDGNLYPSGGIDIAIFDCGSSWSTCASYWSYNGNDSGKWAACGTSANTDVSGATGSGCSARIMEEGWQMNY